MIQDTETLQTEQPNAMVKKPSATPQRRVSDTEPEPFVLQIADGIFNQHNETEDVRIREYVTLLKRQRGSKTNLSESIGVFSLDGSRWLDVSMSNIRVLNIIEPAIRANTTTMSQANVVMNIEPSVSDRKGAASVAVGINEWLESKQWTEHTEFQVCERPQVSAFVFLRQYFDKHADTNKISVPEIIETELDGTGEFACANCGLTGEISASEMTEDGYPCPECQQPTETTQSSENSFVPTINFKQQSYGASKTDVISSFEVRIDFQNTAGGEFQNGKYFEYHTLKTREEIEQEMPHFKLKYPSMPSYPLRWKNALETGLKTVKESWTSQKQSAFDLFEVRYIYLKPPKYKNYRSPIYWSIQDENLNVVFDIEHGETWEEAIQRQSKEKVKPCKGLKFTIIENKLACAPEFADFCEEFAIFQFAPDSFSPYARPFAIILSVQEDVNELNTIMMTHLSKNAISNIVVDSAMFDFEDFEKDFVPTREGKPIDADIRKHFAVVDPPQLGNEPIGYLQFLLAASKDLSGVQPAAMGQAQPGTPYHAQLLQVNQSQGLLATALKSKAQGKIQWLKNHLKLAQKYWSQEQFEKVRTQYGSEWREEDVEDFINCDLDDDILISYVEGSELPKTLMQREIKLQEFIAQVGQFAQLAPGAVTPQMMQELMSKLADQSDIQFDIGNFEGDKRLAETRYERIQMGAEAFTQQGLQIPPPQIDPMTGQETDPMMQVVLRIIQQGRCTPNPRAENHGLHKEFWSDRIRSLQASDDDNELILACADMMWTLHDEAEVAFAQQQMQNQLMAQQPAMEMQQAQQQQQMAQQAEIDGQARQAEMEASEAENARTAEAEGQRQMIEQQRAESQMADSQANREQAEAMKLADLANAERQRQHELEVLKNQPKKESK